MQRPLSTMTAKQLQHWKEHNGHSLITGCKAIGVSQRMFQMYLDGAAPIPLTVAIAVTALTLLDVPDVHKHL